MCSFKEKLVNKEVVLGTMLSEIYTPNIVRMFARAKFEYLFVDCEHGYFDFIELANIAAIGRGFGIKIIVRVPSIQREFITKVLDIGVDGLLLPQIDNPGLAKNAVMLSKYVPEGKRGISTTRAHTDYHVDSVAAYANEANKNLILLAQIESQEGLKNVDAIVNTPGIDGLIVGPNDMAGDFNQPGETFTDEMKARIKTIIESCNKANKPCGIVDSNVSRLKYWQKEGMTIFCMGSEIHLLMSGTKNMINSFIE